MRPATEGEGMPGGSVVSSEWSHDPGLEGLLDDSLGDLDLFQEHAAAALVKQGVDQRVAVGLLARHRSSAKYGYEISPATVEHVLDLRRVLAFRGQGVLRLFSSPFFYSTLLYSTLLLEASSADRGLLG